MKPLLCTPRTHIGGTAPPILHLDNGQPHVLAVTVSGPHTRYERFGEERKSPARAGN